MPNNKFFNIVSDKENQNQQQNNYVQGYQDAPNTFVYNPNQPPSQPANQPMNQGYPSNYNQPINQTPYTDNFVQAERKAEPQAPVTQNESLDESKEVGFFKEALNPNNGVETLDDIPDAPDPLNNGSNPIPVNPVAPVEEKEKIVYEDYKPVGVSPFAVLFMMVDAIIKPGTASLEKGKKYRATSSAIKFWLFFTILSCVFTLAIRIATGGFEQRYNAVNGTYTTGFDTNNILNQNFVQYLLISALIAGGVTLVLSLIYYATSFVNNKGIVIGTYLITSCVSITPLVVGYSILLPLLSIISYYLAYGALAISFIYTIISFVISVNEIMTFQSYDRRILYNLFNITVLMVVIITVTIMLVYGNILYVPQLIQSY